MTRSIAVAGKGGTGKSTLAALIVARLCERGAGPVLAIDADPDANLGTLLGIEAAESIGGFREGLLKEMKSLAAGVSKVSFIEAGLHEVIEEADGFDLLTMGRGEGSGCYCWLNNLIRRFSETLTPSYPWLVLDNEAGLEHISRRTTNDIDALLVVVNDNPLALAAARRIRDLTRELGSRIGKLYVIGNMIRDERRPYVEAEIAALGLEHLADLPYDGRMQELVLRGEPLRKLTESPLVDRIEAIIDRVETLGGTDGDT